jgi:hypothetical protein
MWQLIRDSLDELKDISRPPMNIWRTKLRLAKQS